MWTGVDVFQGFYSPTHNPDTDINTNSHQLKLSQRTHKTKTLLDLEMFNLIV